MKKLLIVLLAAGSIASCKTDNTASEVAEASIQEIKPNNANEIIVAPPSVTDTVNVAKMSFKSPKFDFGTVDEGDVVKHTYHFTNTGKQPLIITNAKSTCGCTVPVWPKEPVEVGDSGTIEVSFNTKGKHNKQQKPVTITANTFPSRTVVYLSGEVTPDPKTHAKPVN